MFHVAVAASELQRASGAHQRHLGFRMMEEDTNKYVPSIELPASGTCFTLTTFFFWYGDSGMCLELHARKDFVVHIADCHECFDFFRILPRARSEIRALS